MEHPSVFADVELGAFCCSATEHDPDPDTCCACGGRERVLRAYIVKLPGLPPMTAEQREWCLSEIDSVEGWRRTDHLADTDADLARCVLAAWTDYCRDKGLL